MSLTAVYCNPQKKQLFFRKLDGDINDALNSSKFSWWFLILNCLQNHWKYIELWNLSPGPTVDCLIRSYYLVSWEQKVINSLFSCSFLHLVLCSWASCLEAAGTQWLFQTHSVWIISHCVWLRGCCSKKPSGKLLWVLFTATFPVLDPSCQNQVQLSSKIAIIAITRHFLSLFTFLYSMSGFSHGQGDSRGGSD